MQVSIIFMDPKGLMKHLYILVEVIERPTQVGQLLI